MFAQIFDNVTDELAEQYEDDFEENEEVESNDNTEGDVFDSIVDRETRRILFDLLHITYHYVRKYKAYQFNEITEIIAEKFEVL